ncbi:ATP-binding protein [Micromonospora sp. WMMD558]|uniref:ATP-binding protein n=1 Tax=Micromonospora sp. WMMD558 TaxID=3403462 RepID=UPI003BF557F3
MATALGTMRRAARTADMSVPLEWAFRRDFRAGSTRIVLAGGCPPDAEPLLTAVLRDGDVDAPLDLVIDLRDLPTVAVASAGTVIAPWAAARAGGPVLTVEPPTHAAGLLPAGPGRDPKGAPGRRRAHLNLPAHPDSPAAARRLVADRCRAWGRPGMMERAVIVTSELVSNAVEHAGTELDVTLVEQAGAVRVSVRDRAADRPDPAANGNLLAERGRGIPIVAALASDWGFVTVGDGKTTWAVVGGDLPADG